MNMTVRFSTYKHTFVYANNHLVTKNFITLCNADGTKIFTDFHKYLKNPDRKIKRFNENGNKRSVYVCKFLNYAFFTAGINNLSELTVEIGENFLNAYGLHELPDDDEFVHRGEESVDKCVKAVLDFYHNLIDDKNSGCTIKKEDMFRYVTKRDKRGKAYKKKMPVFDVLFIPEVKKPIYRDIPNSAFVLLFDHIVEHHKDILGIVMHQAFAGLRPAEACNVRRRDVGGIKIKDVQGELRRVTIDLKNELNLRSDLICVGGIKKERDARVPDIFLNAYREAYNIYTEYLEGKPYEAEYSPFSVNSQGKAMTYDSYYKKFRAIIQDEMIPIFLKSNDPEVVLYGQTLMENSLSPHVFRHWYTVQLVLSGIEHPGVLKDLRGDSNPESALTYIKSKGDLEKQYSKITNETFNYTLWAAKKKHNERI